MTSPLPSGPFRIGLIGCGAISNQYFQHLAPFSAYAGITVCADLDVDRAQAKAKEHGVPKACSVDEVLADPDVDAVLNLTVPGAHAGVNLKAIRAGKHAYCEKPFALTYVGGLAVLQEADAKGVRLGCAPDTVLGGGIQTCRKLIDEGAIGRPIHAVANMLCHGHESWHPNPEFYYKAGGGPLFDMGPYYLTSLVTMLGPVASVSALARTTFTERLITSQPFAGKEIKVDVPTHLSGLLEFGQNVTAAVTMSFDVWAQHLPMLEVYGTEGSIQCPDPNGFRGDVSLWTTKSKAWEKIPLTQPADMGRGVGLAEMANSIRKGTAQRMSGALGLHVVEVMESFHNSAASEKKIALKSSCDRPKAMPLDVALGQLD